MNRPILTAAVAAALGFTGIALLLPRPLARLLLDRVERATGQIVAAAAGAWEEP